MENQQIIFEIATFINKNIKMSNCFDLANNRRR